MCWVVFTKICPLSEYLKRNWSTLYLNTHMLLKLISTKNVYSTCFQKYAYQITAIVL